MVNVTGPGAGGPGFVDGPTEADPTLKLKPAAEQVLLNDSLSPSDPNDGAKRTGGPVGSPGQDIELEDGGSYDTESLGREMSTSDWLDTSYNVAFFSNMQEALDDIAESQQTEAFASREAATASFDNSMTEAELIEQKSLTEAEKLTTTAITSLVMSVGMATAGLATSFASSKMSADAKQAENDFKQYKKDYPDDVANPERAQASYNTRREQYDADLAAHNNASGAAGRGDDVEVPPHPGREPINPKDQFDENGQPRYIEMERRANNASAVSNTIINNLGRTIPDVVSNLIQAGYTVQIGQMEMGITIQKALESMYDRQKQNASAAESAQRDQFGEFVRTLNSVIDSRLQAFRLQG